MVLHVLDVSQVSSQMPLGRHAKYALSAK